MEQFHFGPAPAPASQDGGCGSGSSSSASPVVHNLLLKKVFKNFTSQFTGACFIQRKERMLCFALKQALYLKRQNNFILNYYCKFFCSSYLNIRAVELEPEPPLFYGSGQKGRLRLHNTARRVQHFFHLSFISFWLASCCVVYYSLL